MGKKSKKRLENENTNDNSNSFEQTELEYETNHKIKRKRDINHETKTDQHLKTSGHKFNEWILEKSRQYTSSVPPPEDDKSEENSEIIEKRQKKPKDKEKIRLKKLKLKEEKLKKRAENRMNEKLASKNALDYLHRWKLHHDTWSFKKNRQCWLLKHLYDDQQISDEDFEILLRYLENVKGVARERIISEAENKIKEFEKQIEKKEDLNENTEENSAKENIKEYRRAGLLIQILV